MQRRTTLPLALFMLLLISIPLMAAPVTRQTVLPDGMRVIVREDHTAPVVSLMVWVGVGSRNEVQGNRGISHFIEHLLFKGTKKRAVGEVSREVGALGGRMNAATSYDTTQFFIEIGSRYFDNALDIFSDVIQNSSFDPGEVNKERSVVQEEIRMYRDDPGHRQWFALTGEAFKKHPYRYPIAATVDEVQQISRQQILDYFHRYYVPQNMVVVAVGDINADDAMKKIAAAFAQFPKDSMPKDKIPGEPAQTGIRRVTERMDINQAYLAMAYHVPSIGNPDSYALDVLSQILGSGRSSRMYRALREEKQLVYTIGFSYEPLKDEALMAAFADMDAGKVPEVEKEILAQIAEVQAKGVTDAEVKRAKAKTISDWAFAHETYEQESEEIGYFQLLGYPDYPETYVARINQVTPADVQRVARKYLNPKAYTIATILPKTQGAMGTGEPRGAGFAQGSDAEKSDEPQMTTLPNGLRVITRESHSADTVSVQLLVNVGSRDETAKNNGITTLVHEVIDQGTTSRNALQIAETLENAGVRLSASGGEDYSSIVVNATRGGLDTGLEVLADLARNANFPDKEVEKERRQILNAIAQQENEADSYAAKLFRETFYQKSPYHFDPLGTKDSVKALTPREVRDYYHRFYQPQNMVMVVVGNFDKGALLAQVSKLFGEMPRGETPARPALSEPEREKPTVVVRDKEGEQAVLLLGMPAPSMGSPDYAALKVLNTALGGGMTSILYDRVREKRGLAYVVASSFPGKTGPSYLVAQAGTKPQTVETTRQEILATLSDVATKGVTKEQFESAKRFYLGNFDLNHQTAEDRAGFLGAYEIRGLGYQYDREFPKQVEAVTYDDVNRVARKYLTNNGYTLVIVKPAETKKPVAGGTKE